VISVQATVSSIELRNPTESQPIEITQLIFQSASKTFGISQDLWSALEHSYDSAFGCSR
jgi:hypothetical protein